MILQCWIMWQKSAMTWPEWKVDVTIWQCHGGIFCPININLGCTSDVISVWPGLNKYVDGVAVSDNFSAIRESAVSVSAHLWVTDKGAGSINKEAIQKELATFNCEYQHAEKYVGSPNVVLHKGYERTLHEKFVGIIQEMKIMRDEVVICERSGFSQTFERRMLQS